MNHESPEDREQRRTRLENELREILERTDRPPSNVVKFKSRVRQRRIPAVPGLRSGSRANLLTGFNLLIAAIVFAVLAAFVDDSSNALARLLAVGSIAALVGLFVLYFRRPDQPSVKQWRGRDIDVTPPKRPAWFDRRFGGPRRPKR